MLRFEPLVGVHAAWRRIKRIRSQSNAGIGHFKVGDFLLDPNGFCQQGMALPDLDATLDLVALPAPPIRWFQKHKNVERGREAP